MEASEAISFYPAAVITAVLSVLTIVLDIPPLVWHFRHRNIAACSLVFWILILNVTVFVNALIWPNDNISSWWDGRGLCDVEVKLFVGAIVAIPGALACTLQGLAKVLDTENVVLTPSRSDRRKRIAIDFIFCFGFPVFFMVAHYVVQQIRYFIWGIAGCNTPYDNSWVSIVLIFIWPPILTLLDAYYAGLVVLRLYRYRRDLSRFFEASRTSKSRFMRLFLMSIILVVGFVPVQIYVLIVNVSVPHHPYSWNKVHGEGWNQAIMIPSNGQVLFDRWIWLACGFLVFCFFGVGGDAVKMYKSWLVALGFSRIFPGLQRSGGSSGPNSSSWSSLSSKAKLVFGRRQSSGSPLSTSISTSTTAKQPECVAETTHGLKRSLRDRLSLRPYIDKFRGLQFRKTSSSWDMMTPGREGPSRDGAAVAPEFPHPLTSVVVEMEAPAFTKVWEQEMSSGTKATLRGADDFGKTERRRSSETLSPDYEVVDGSRYASKSE